MVLPQLVVLLLHLCERFTFVLEALTLPWLIVGERMTDFTYLSHACEQLTTECIPLPYGMRLLLFSTRCT